MQSIISNNKQSLNNKNSDVDRLRFYLKTNRHNSVLLWREWLYTTWLLGYVRPCADEIYFVNETKQAIGYYTLDSCTLCNEPFVW